MDTVSNIVNSVLDEKGWRGKVLEKMAVEIWSDIVGSPMNQNTLAERCQGGTLFVRARSPQWTHELHFLEARIIARLNGRLRKPIVQKIRSRVTMPPGKRKDKVEPNWEDPTFPEKPNDKATKKPVPTNDAAAIRGREIAQDITDPEMRATMERLIASVMRAQDEKKLEEKAAIDDRRLKPPAG